MWLKFMDLKPVPDGERKIIEFLFVVIWFQSVEFKLKLQLYNI